MKIEMSDDEIEIIEDSELNIKCIAGGSLISHPALFGNNGEVLYLIWKSCIKLYSVITGEWIKDLNDNKNDSIVGMHFDTTNSKLLVACTKSGNVYFWKTESYVVSHKIKLQLDTPKDTVLKFEKIILKDDGSFAVISYKKSDSDSTGVGIFDLASGKSIQAYDLKLNNAKVKIQDSGKDLDFFALTQLKMLYVADKNSNQFFSHRNPVNFTALCCHPTKEVIATGDMMGKILLWQNFFSNQPVKTQLHWHHMAVSCLRFSLAGTVLYSGGNEMVLVKWTLGNSIEKDFLPRFSGALKHISVDSKNDKLAVTTDDNAVQIINAQFCQTAVVQNFTRIPTYYDFSDQNPFKIGIKLNPRNNSLIMNGRIGYLQFFSTYTQRMLFNMDITLRNLVPREKTKAVYNTRITNVAVSLCWMATVEEWNDNEHSPEIKLRFWEFLSDKQRYSLNTHVELPHQKSITSLEFSSKYDSDNLICASASLDKSIKIWSLETTENIHKKSKVWMCIEQITYKNLSPISLNFSQDASLLAAGFGNVLCVWDSTTFKLKCALSAPACMDGSATKLTILLPSKNSEISDKKKSEKIKDIVEKRKQIIEEMKMIVSGEGDERMLKKFVCKKQRHFKKQPKLFESVKNLTLKEKQTIFRRIFMINELSFNQKINLLHKLNIACSFSENMEEEVRKYLEKHYENHESIKHLLQSHVKDVRDTEKYDIQRKFQESKKDNCQEMFLLKNILQLSSMESKSKKEKSKKNKHMDSENASFFANKSLPTVTNVLFCSEEFSHLVIVTTQDRLLIWNLLTLKLQVSYKLSVKCIALDSVSNLIAVFTKTNELFVFLPNVAMTIYHRKNMPDIFGAVWVPRKHPKTQSINVNWQATSQLYFLNSNQELSHLISDTDDEILGPVAYFEDFTPVVSNTPFAAMMSKQLTDGTSKDTAKWSSNRIGFVGNSISEFINPSNHTMAPMSLLSKDFVRSLLATENEKLPSKKEETPKSPEVYDDILSIFAENTFSNLNYDDDNMEVDVEISDRKQKQENIEKELKGNKAKKADSTNLEKKLSKLKIDAVVNFEI